MNRGSRLIDVGCMNLQSIEWRVEFEDPTRGTQSGIEHVVPDAQSHSSADAPGTRAAESGYRCGGLSESAEMNRRSVIIVAFGATACGSGALAGPQPVRNVVLSVDVPGRCLFGGCDPVSGDRTTLALVRAVNRGSDTSFIAMCGPNPAFAEQQLIDGRWQFTGPAAACVNGPLTMALAPGDSVLTNWYPPKGTSRMALGVGASASPQDLELDASNAVRLR